MKNKKHEDRKALKRAGAARKKDVLACSKRAVAAIGKPGTIGNPFKKGEDPRRHKLGRVSLDRAAAAAKINNYLCNGTGDPAELAVVLWKHALKGEAWAVSELLDRICGNVPRAVQIEEPARKFIIVYADEALEPAATDPRAERELSLSPKTEDHHGR